MDLPKGLGRSALFLLSGLALGLLLSLAWNSAADWRASTADPRGIQAEAVVARLEAEQRQLRLTLSELRAELAQRQQAAAARTDLLQDLTLELERQRVLAGLTPVRGPGVHAILDDAAAPVSAEGEADGYLVHDYDLRDVVNLLWLAGSEAIAINGERLVANSSLTCVGSTVMVNDTRLSPPYHIWAIGDPRVLQDYLRNPAYLKSLKERQGLYGVRFDVEGLNAITLPAYDGGFLIRYARPGE